RGRTAPAARFLGSAQLACFRAGMAADRPTCPILAFSYGWIALSSRRCQMTRRRRNIRRLCRIPCQPVEDNPLHLRVAIAIAWQLPNPRVTFPLDVCHLACDNVDFERAEAPDAGFPPLERYFVMAWRQRCPKASLGIGRK